ncbi:MAG TPA: restriction endonuclease subunit S [Burkholderiales bacterium]|nr:restriction endonuclease subunit S [Burkholderiales bacterium]
MTTTRRVGEMLLRLKTPVEIRDSESYKRLTIRINHQGVSVRDTEIGANIGTKNQFRVCAGDFILSKIDARQGAFGIVPREADGGIITGNFWTYRVDNEIVDTDWFLQFTNSDDFLDLCKRSSTGNTHRKYLNEDIFLNHELAIPSLDEQRKAVVSCTSGSERLAIIQSEITRQQFLIIKLKQAILQEAIQGKLTTDWRAAHPDVEPGSQLLHRIQADKAHLIAGKKPRPERPPHEITAAEIPFEIPRGWEWCRTSDIGTVIGGLTKNAAKRDGHKRVLPYLRVANVYANRLDLTDLQEIGVADSEVEKLLLEKDDMLVVEGNGSRDQVGRIALWDGSVDPCVHQNHVIKVRLGEPKVAPWALCWFLSPSGRALIEEQARTSTGLYNLSTGKVANLPIPLPPLAEQGAIVERVEALMTTCRALESEIEHYRTHAAHLLQAVLKEAFAPAKELTATT